MGHLVGSFLGGSLSPPALPPFPASPRPSPRLRCSRRGRSGPGDVCVSGQAYHFLDYAIRFATAEDGAFLAEMLLEAADWRGASDRRPEDALADDHLARYVEDWIRPGDVGVIAEVRAKPVGAAWMRTFSSTRPGYGFISPSIPELGLAVHADHRRRGIGRDLIQRLAEIARFQGYEAISLSVEEDNPALGLYERVGFRPVVRSGNSLTMRLDLQPGST